MGSPFLTPMDAELLKHLEEIKAGQREASKRLGKMEQEISDLKKGQDTILEIIEDQDSRQDAMENRLLQAIEAAQADRNKRESEYESIVSEQQRQREEEEAGTHLLSEHGLQLIDHEKRIKQLENVGAR
jgi:hypothetical protein